MPLTKKFNRRNRKTRRRRSVKRRRLPRSLASTATKFMKLKYTYALTADGAGLIDDILSTSNPTKAKDGSGTYEHWNSLIGLYDQFKVHAIRLMFIPSVPNNTSSTVAFAPLYLVQDKDDDGTSAIANTAEAIQYDNLAVKNLYRPWQYYRKVPLVQDANSITIGRSGYHDAAVIPDVGAVKMYGPGLTALGIYGDIIATLYVSFREVR